MTIKKKLIQVFCMSALISSVGAADESDDAIVATILQKHYAPSSESETGWVHHEKAQGPDGPSGTYCIKADSPHKVKHSDGVEQIYVSVTGDECDQNATRYDPGLHGFFVMQKSAGEWEIVAAKKASFAGINGGSAPKLDFVHYGKDTYGWHYSEGSSWQGVVASSHFLVGLVGNNIQSIGQFNEMAEDDQSHEYTIEYDAEHALVHYGPLKYHQKNVATGKIIATRMVDFDDAKKYYSAMKTPFKAPLFKDFSVAVTKEPAAKKVVQQDDPFAKMYRTRLQEGLMEGINFAGKYHLVFWGCGSGGCVNGTIIDVSTGEVLQSDWISTITGFSSAQSQEWEDVEMYMRPNSRLFVLKGYLDGMQQQGTFFLEFKNGDFKLIQKNYID